MFKAMLYDWFGLNQAVFLLFNGVHNAVIDPLMLLGTVLADYRNMALVLAVMAAGVWWRWRRSQSAAMHRALRLTVVAAASYGIAVCITGLGKYLFDFPRPLLALPGHVVVLGHEKFVHSFPSGHAMFAMLMAALFWNEVGRAGRAALLLFVVWAGLSRMVVGAHFPADVMAGYAVGAISVLGARAGLAWSARALRAHA